VAVGKGDALKQFKRKGKKGVCYFSEVENGLQKVETDSGNFDFKWPLAFWGHNSYIWYSL
jgi:hypothetical protein